MEKLKINWEPWTIAGPNSFVGRIESQEGYKFQALVILGMGRFGTWQLTYELQEPNRVVPTIQGAQSGIEDQYQAFELAREICQLTLQQERERAALSSYNIFSKYLPGATDGTTELF
ncbi:MAG: hypothetical protein JO235_04095 [Chroococcidiopsidaceae cyanobacterium CP_BM_RX_35]|nr:hypothetical protein [Chroococcidiopsidaceae cyanobacterium CP_BM_RX_35]